MNKLLSFSIAILLSTTLFSNVYAASPEQNCRAKKNRVAARYIMCRHKVFSGRSQSSFERSAIECGQKINRKWRRITKVATRNGATCLDAPLQISRFRRELNKNIKSVTSLLGKKLQRNAARRKCRAQKTIIAGRYAACKLRAESRLVFSGDTTAFDSRIARCETILEKAWQNIIDRTADRGATCFDDSRTVNDYKQTIDAHISRVTTVLAGNNEFDPLPLSVTGSPLALTAGGGSQSLTITNNSTKGTATAIAATFAESALEGKVTESGNTCATLVPGASCTLTFTAGSTIVPLTAFTIQGSNTAEVSASIEIVTPDTASISIAGSPLSLTANGSAGNLTITNTSLATTALAIVANFTGTALDGQVVESGNTCGSVPPGASCTLSFTPGSSVVPLTAFSIQGFNTTTATPSISIESGVTLTAVSANSGSASGLSGVTLTGTGLTGTLAVTFDGLPATSVNVVNSSTVTAVTPAHATGAVDVIISTPAGNATLVNGYTYVATSVGQSTAGGTIACLNGGLDNMIAATSDNAAAIEWGALGAIGPGARSNTDGAANTAEIVTTLGAGSYAAQLCADYEVDSQGNTPCEAGNACYNDWFLPARQQLACLSSNSVSIGGFITTDYWTSTEFDSFLAWATLLPTISESLFAKSNFLRVRCVRAFSP